MDASLAVSASAGVPLAAGAVNWSSQVTVLPAETSLGAQEIRRGRLVTGFGLELPSPGLRPTTADEIVAVTGTPLALTVTLTGPE
jgi:hypothetical protein